VRQRQWQAFHPHCERRESRVPPPIIVFLANGLLLVGSKKEVLERFLGVIRNSSQEVLIVHAGFEKP
jgi:hypothetical protein